MPHLGKKRYDVGKPLEEENQMREAHPFWSPLKCRGEEKSQKEEVQMIFVCLDLPSLGQRLGTGKSTG